VLSWVIGPNVLDPAKHSRLHDEGTQVMKRILLSVVAASAFALCGLFTSTAQAHGPHGHGHGCRPGYGGYGGYGYGGYAPSNVYYPRYVPYGAGYSGGWQPYQGFYYQQPRFGLYVGF
jgi:hypothetical protein